MKKIIGLLLLVVVLAGCYTTTQQSQTPYGYWSGYVDSTRYGKAVALIAADYDNGRWAMCHKYATSTRDCVAYYTDGWDLVDAAGDRFTATYNGTAVYVTHTFSDGDRWYSTMTPEVRGSSTQSVTEPNITTLMEFRDYTTP